jgi:membrane peptidoglycan carboxypeptidase
MQHAVVAAEDRTFWTNKGVDFKSIVRAAFSNARGNATQGASTITQQYVKFLYLSVEHLSVKQKIKQIFLSLKLQHEESKQQILAGYLNTIYFGRDAYGVEAAAQAYFGEDSSQLTVPQAAMLSAIVNSPNFLDPTGNKTERAALLARYRYVLGGMVKLGYLDAGKEEQAAAHLPKVVTEAHSDQYGGQRGFMLTMVKKELLNLGFSEEQIDGGGLHVTTTFNRKVMSADRKAVQTRKPHGLKQLHVGVASVNVANGALEGFYGGQNFLTSQLNYATLPSASVGSSFKPFALAAALKQGFTLNSTFDGNSPYTFPDGTTVHNEGEAEGQSDGTSYGSHINLIYALQQSVNTAFVDMTASMKDGPDAIKSTALAMGIPKTDDVQANSRIALGSASIAPVDMANAYSTIANRGVEHSWYVIKKVTDSSGKVLYKHKVASKRVIPKNVADDVSYAMQQVINGGTGENAKALGRAAAGKTGTATNQNGDVDSSWFVGFTPQVSTAVMYMKGTGHESLVGYLVPYFGATYPTETWTTAMSGILAGVPVATFPPEVALNGTPPSSGHAPYTPPPVQPTHSTKPTKGPTAPATTAPPTTPPPSTAPPSPTSSPTCTGVGCL